MPHQIDYEAEGLLPPHMIEGFKLWIDEGIEPSSFGTAVIENDLSGAVGRADYINARRISEIVKWFHWQAPSLCWGSHEKAVQWRNMGGLNGLRRIQETEKNEKSAS